MVHPNGGDHRVIRRATEQLRFFKAGWSPDGHKMLVGCNDPNRHVDKLCVMDATGHDVHIVIDVTPDSVNFPAWGSHRLKP